MSDLLHEQLSALIDGELPSEETALLLKRLKREPELRERLARYRVCGETLRGARVQVREEFSLKVTARLEAEPCHTAVAVRPTVAPRRFLRAAGGLGVAAAVAAAAILVLGRPGGLGGQPVQVAQTPPVPAVDRSAVDRLNAQNAAIGPRSTPPSSFTPIGSEPASYVTPAAHTGLAVIPQGELANYVVVHSEVGRPFGVGSGLTNLVTDDPASRAVQAR